MTKDKALELALEALQADELDMVDDGSGNMIFRKEQAITAIKEALAQPEQEPVAWMDADGNVSDNNDHKCFPIPLYTHPPQRTWVRLTNQERSECWDTIPERAMKKVEAKLKEKNT